MNLYRIHHIETVAPLHYRVSVALDPEHPVFAGHFPGNPVLPGVCSLQMIIECAGEALGFPVMMIEAPVVKFLEIIRPTSDSELVIDILANDELTVKAAITSGERKVVSCSIKLKKLDKTEMKWN